MNTFRLPALALLALLAMPHPAHAQLGGLIKKKVTEAVKAPDKGKDVGQEKHEPGQGPVFDDIVVRITEPVMKGFLKGKRLEVEQLTDFKNVLLKYRSEEDYDACTKSIAMTPEGQKIALQMASMPPGSSAQEVQKLIEKMNLDMNALVARKCGASILTEWPDYNRQQKVNEIHENGAEAAGLLLFLDEQGRPVKGGSDATFSQGSDGDGGGNLALEGNELAIGLETSVLQGQKNSTRNKKSTKRYDTVDERLRAWCAMKKATGYQPQPGDTVAFPATRLDPKASAKFIWRFEPQEWKLLEILGCPELELSTGPIEILELLMDEIKIVGKPGAKVKK